MKKNKIKTPWYNFYDGVKAHLDYPNISLYKMLENSALKHKDCISYNYYGTKRTYKEFVQEVDKCARAFKALGIECSCTFIYFLNK